MAVDQTPDVKCSTCGHRWKQHGNRTGHCGGDCHQTYEGSNLFDWHQTCTDDGTVVCRTPHSEDWDPKLVWTGQSWQKPFKKPESWD